MAVWYKLAIVTLYSWQLFFLDTISPLSALFSLNPLVSSNYKDKCHSCAHILTLPLTKIMV